MFSAGVGSRCECLAAATSSFSRAAVARVSASFAAVSSATHFSSWFVLTPASKQDTSARSEYSASVAEVCRLSPFLSWRGSDLPRLPDGPAFWIPVPIVARESGGSSSATCTLSFLVRQRASHLASQLSIANTRRLSLASCSEPIPRGCSRCMTRKQFPSWHEKDHFSSGASPHVR